MKLELYPILLSLVSYLAVSLYQRRRQKFDDIIALLLELSAGKQKKAGLQGKQDFDYSS